MGTDETWRERLDAAVKTKGRTRRDVSLAAGLAHGYVHSILGKEQKSPSVANLIKVCDELGVTLSFILYGFDLTPEAERFLRLFQAATPDKRQALLALLQPTT